MPTFSNTSKELLEPYSSLDTPTNLRLTAMTPYSVSLEWNPSTENSGSVKSVIHYDVYVNGAFDHSLMDHGSTMVYGNLGVENTYQVIAVDSAPASLTTCAAAVC